MLTDNKIKGLKPTEKRYSLSAGEGLSIDVMPTGRKSWVLEYTALGKRKRKKLGEYPAISLKQARELANKIKDNAGLTPITVSELIHEWVELYSKQWTSEKYKYTVIYRLTYITNDFKDMMVADVSRAMVSKAVSQMVAQGTYETAKRSLRLLSQVFNYAIAHEYAQNNPCTLVDNIIPTHTVQNMATLSANEMVDFWRTIRKTPTIGLAPIALSLANYLAVRPSELCKATWGEFDLDKGIWEIPAERMKKRRTHVVPLSKQALALLQQLHSLTGFDTYLFPSRAKDRKNAHQRFRMALKRLGYHDKQALHGFRHIASTKLNNYTDENGMKFDGRVIEFALAHKVQGVTGVYNKAEYLHDRKIINQWYSDFLDSLVQANDD